jgi:two-component system LytT family response regulator
MEKELRAFIVDDEVNSRQTLSSMIERYYPNVKIIGEADGAITAISRIKKTEIDVLFLDIQMPDGSGFYVLEQLQPINFDVIFTTAFDKFAIRAIKTSALDYLLKPIDPDELALAINKAEVSNQKRKANIDVLLENINPKTERKKIMLHTFEGMHMVYITEIVRCEADDYYTRFFLQDGKVIMVSKTLKETEELLDDLGFIRTHKSHMVNISFVKTFVRNDGGYLILKNGDRVPVSRRKKEEVLDVLNKY